MKAVITITDNPSGTANVEVFFDLALPREDEERTQAAKIAVFMLEQMQKQAKSFKQKALILEHRDKPK